MDSGMGVPSAVRRAGGLCDMGFEYCLVPCKKHAAEKDPYADTKTLCFDCSTRLFHIDSGVLISADNRKQYILDGPMFDEVASVCQEIAQERILQTYPLELVTICDDPSRGEPVKALVDNTYTKQQPTLLIITGKGKSRLGILSFKQLVTSGLEIGSAMFHISEAKKRGLAVILLDPNARGIQNSMETIEKSMARLFASWSGSPLYVLAHSAAGGFFVRYLLLGHKAEGDEGDALRRDLRIAFTDSTHNIQWTRDDPALFDLLQSRRCLYVRNTSTRPSDTFQDHRNRKLGQEAECDIWWTRRFGGIRTVWAGTTDHSLIFWSAREIIWDFFDTT